MDKPAIAPAPLYTPVELARIQADLTTLVGEYLKGDESLVCTGLVDPLHMELVAELSTASRDEVTRFEAAVDFADEKAPSLANGRAVLVEFLGAMCLQWMRESRWPPPHLDWKEYRFEDHTLLFRGSQVNEALERMADAWLEKGGDPAS